MLSNRILLSTGLSAAPGATACGENETKLGSCMPLSARTESETIGPWGGVLELSYQSCTRPSTAVGFSNHSSRYAVSYSR